MLTNFHEKELPGQTFCHLELANLKIFNIEKRMRVNISFVNVASATLA